MINRFLASLAAVAAWFTFMAAAPAADAGVDVDIHVGVPLPRLVIPAAPFLIVIPGTYVYYPPDVDADILFYHGYWYRSYRSRWFISAEYNGPWKAVKKVPHAVRTVPAHYRGAPSQYERVPYGDVRRNWRAWEKDRHWDKRGEGQDEGRGKGRGNRGRGHDRDDR